METVDEIIKYLRDKIKIYEAQGKNQEFNTPEVFYKQVLREILKI